MKEGTYRGKKNANKQIRYEETSTHAHKLVSFNEK